MRAEKNGRLGQLVSHLLQVPSKPYYKTDLFPLKSTFNVWIAKLGLTLPQFLSLSVLPGPG